MENDRPVLSPAGSRPTHFDPFRVVREDIPKPSRRTVAQRRSGATGQDSSQTTPIWRKRQTAKDIDTGIRRVQKSVPKPALDNVPAQAAGQQLLSRHDAVLSPRQLDQSVIPRDSN